MSTIKAAPRSVPAPPAPVNGSAPAGQRIGVGRPRRVSWIMLGLMLTAGAALAFLLALSSAGDRVVVVTAARDLQPGQPIKETDLRAVSINADSPVNSLAADRGSELVGRVPLAPLSAGTLLHPGLFAAGSDLAAGETVVGAALQPGDVPTDNLRPGDRVGLVEVASPNSTDTGTSTVITVGSIYSVTDSADTRDIIVSVRVPLAQGAAVANVAGQKRLRLILVPTDASSDQLVPAASAAPDSSNGSTSTVVNGRSGSDSSATTRTTER